MLTRRYYPAITRNLFEPLDIMNNLEQARKQLYRMFDYEEEQDKTTTTFPIELSETAEAYHLKALIPGVEGDKIDVNATEDTLTLKVNWELELLNNTPRPENSNENQIENAEQNKENAEQNKTEQTSKPVVHVREFKYGHMERTIQFSQPILNDQIQAHFKNGVLTLTIPKEVPPKKRPVKIKVA